MNDLTKEGAAFEAFLRTIDIGDFTGVDEEGFYDDHGTQRAWAAWQARAALSTPAVPAGHVLVPVELTDAMWEAYKRPRGVAADVSFNERWAALLAAAPQQPGPAVQGEAWIPVSERLPDDPQHCVFYSPDLRNPVSMLMGLYIRGAFKCAGFEMVNVTHWAPPPHPPVQTQGGEK